MGAQANLNQEGMRIDSANDSIVIRNYGAYTSYYLHLLLNEIHPKDHQLSKEIKRLQEFKSKITLAVKGEEEPEKEKEKKKSYKGIKSMLTN